MHISVRQQLSLLLVLSGGIGLAVLAIAIWVVDRSYVLDVAATRIQTTASLKAAQIAYTLELMQTATAFVASKAVIQDALGNYNNGSDVSPSNWQVAQANLEATLGNTGAVPHPLVLQAQVFSEDDSGIRSVLNATGTDAQSIELPWRTADGGAVHLGDAGTGYPPALYPNLTVSHQQMDGTTPPTFAAEVDGLVLDKGTNFVLGPLLVNGTFTLISITGPIINNTDSTDVIGWMTVVADARLIQLVIQDETGLGKTGQTLLVGSPGSTNLFPTGVLDHNGPNDFNVSYKFPLNSSVRTRHPEHVVGTANLPFSADSYPAVAEAMMEYQRGVNNAGHLLCTHDEEDMPISVGFATPPTTLVDWIILVEEERSQVWAPLDHVRTVIVACFFAVLGFMLLVSFPLAHWAVSPIRKLRAATEATVAGDGTSSDLDSSFGKEACQEKAGIGKLEFLQSVKRLGFRKQPTIPAISARGGDDQQFRIPSKVSQSRHWVQDELTGLIATFNQMSDELFGQYTKLDDKVRQRTIELEHSKKAAEAANESKTMFVANVSHELKTPLNGILGMCAISLEEEDDPSKLKQSLGIIHKSGNLLLRTLNDLLTFSTNQVGHQLLTLDMQEFVLSDMETQIHSIFGQQAKDCNIDLGVRFEEPTAGSDHAVGLRDSILWGDVHRILQILINLISNGLKFTPAGGSVTVSICCLPESSVHLPLKSDGIITAASRHEPTRTGSGIVGTANFINPQERNSIPNIDIPHARPPGHGILVEFSVQDTGPGIPVEMQKRIFEPFVQGDVGLSRKHSGTGLGLSICSQLASLMRGSIELRSTVGKGALFSVKIPLRQIAGKSPPKSSLEDATGRLISTNPAGTGTETAVTQHTICSDSKNSKTLAYEPIEVIESACRDGEKADNRPQKEPKSESSCAEVPPQSLPLRTQTPTEAEGVSAATDQQDALEPKTGDPGITKPGKDVEAAKEAQQKSRTIRVLVAEDNKVNQEVIRRMLRLEKIHEVTIAEDGQKALDLIRSNSSQATPAAADASDGNVDLLPPYDIIFMDIQMPNMDGLTATKLIRASGFQGPIVALTAFAEQSNQDECLSSGMDHFLAKPIRRPLLKKVLTDYCSYTSG